MSGKSYPASSAEEVMGSLARALYEKCGEAELPLISSLFGTLGDSAGQKMREKVGAVNFSVAVSKFFSPALKAVPPRAEFVELTDDKLVIKAFTCRIGLKGAGRKVCEAIMELDRNMISSLTGEKVAMQIEKSIAAGDDCCLIKFQVEGK